MEYAEAEAIANDVRRYGLRERAEERLREAEVALFAQDEESDDSRYEVPVGELR